MIRSADHATRRRTIDALVHVLPRSVRVTEGRKHVVLVNGVPFRVSWAGEGWLRDVQPILTQRSDQPDVVIARRMSPGARAALEKAGIGWVDETGAAEIARGAIVISKEGQDGTPVLPLSHWTGAVLGVAEAVLCGTKATVSAIQTATGLSTGSCSNALRFLTAQGFLEADAKRGRQAARRVASFDNLLDAYSASAAAMRVSPSLSVGVVGRDLLAELAEIGMRWDALGWRWACTGAAAAALLAPYLTSIGTVDVYVATNTIAGLAAAATDIELRPIVGGRMTLRPFPTPVSERFSTQQEGLRVAPWPRVYADLLSSGVRGEEAAAHLREVLHDG